MTIKTSSLTLGLQLSEYSFYYALSKGAKYCDQHIGVYVCLSVPGPMRARLGPGGLCSLMGPPQAASPPESNIFFLSENTPVYTTGVNLGYRINAALIRLLPHFQIKQHIAVMNKMLEISSRC